MEPSENLLRFVLMQNIAPRLELAKRVLRKEEETKKKVEKCADVICKKYEWSDCMHKWMVQSVTNKCLEAAKESFYLLFCEHVLSTFNNGEIEDILAQHKQTKAIPLQYRTQLQQQYNAKFYLTEKQQLTMIEKHITNALTLYN